MPGAKALTGQTSHLQALHSSPYANIAKLREKEIVNC